MLSCGQQAAFNGNDEERQRSSWAQRPAETQPNVSHLLEVTSYMDVVTLSVYVCVCVCKCGKEMLWCVCVGSRG